MRERKKQILLITLLLLTIVGIGYAALQSNLNIIGHAEIVDAKWDIHFDNITVTNGSVEINTTVGDSAATINPNDNTEVTYSVTLEKPGDYYEFLVDVKNFGTIDGMIETITSTLKINDDEPIVIADDNSNLPSYLDYNITYSDNLKIEPNHELKAGEKETYKVRVEFKTDINPGDLPTTSSTLDFSMKPKYAQANDNAVASHPSAIENYLYAFLDTEVGGLYVSVGDSVSELGDTFHKSDYTTYCYIQDDYLENGNIMYFDQLSCSSSHIIGYNEFESLNDCENYLTSNDYSGSTCVRRPPDATGNISTDWSASGAKTMLRLSIDNSNIVERVDVCYVNDNNLYCLKGLTSSNDPNKQQIYLDNKAVLDSSFNNCRIEYTDRYQCSNTTFDFAYTELTSSEFVDVDTNDNVYYYGYIGVYCYLLSDGDGSCAVKN